ncbi:kinase-like protein [Jackrogersella minutella]|nr:kinase-like protein [Jackrogersella minutella]
MPAMAQPNGRQSNNNYKILHRPCYDRGDLLRHKAQNGCSPLVGNPKENPPQDYESLYSALWEELVQISDNETSCFIPFDVLQLAKNPKLVELTLKEEKYGISETDISKLRDAICSNEAIKGTRELYRIFSILVMNGQAGSIIKFVEQGVDDSHLPFPSIKRRRGEIQIDRSKLKYQHPQVKDEVLKIIFEDEAHWGYDGLSNFNTRQWWAIAPFFSREEKIIPHYVLESGDVFPFIEKKRDPFPQIEVDTQDGGKSVNQEIWAKEGGFSDVSMVKIHPSHCDFGKYEYSNGSNSYALKRLKSRNANEFNLEVDALRKYNHGIDKHLIPLLATIEKEDESSKYYLLFPKANGDLHHFWMIHFDMNTDTSYLKWMARQCLGITKALSMLHQDQDDDKNEDYPIYGRHGDIKAANILWFAKPDSDGPSSWQLVLSDFGLMRFHRFMSRSIETARNLKKTITYQAPEFDIAKISRKSDIWALGCTFLEFITCCLLGYQAVSEDFPSDRGEYDERLKFDADKFYRTIRKVAKDGQSVELSAELKPQVRDWVSNLHQRPECSQYLHDFLYLIENEMLRINRDQRPSASQVVEKLQELLEKWDNGTYFSGHSNGQENGKL